MFKERVMPARKPLPKSGKAKRADASSSDVVVGAGAVVVKPVEDGVTVIGCPARALAL